MSEADARNNDHKKHQGHGKPARPRVGKAGKGHVGKTDRAAKTGKTASALEGPPSEWLQRLRAEVDQRPFRAVAIAAGVGALAGAALLRPVLGLALGTLVFRRSPAR